MELKANLSIHGTPCGHDFNGEESESKYCELFYDGIADVAKMIVEVVDMPSGSVCHYTYKVSKDVTDVNGRPGGYIALTLSINQLCANTKIIYEMLRSVFDMSVLRTFIVPKATGYQHLVGRYSDSSDALEAMRKNCFGLLRSLNNGIGSVMVPINSANRNGIVQINPDDVTNEELMKDIQIHRRVEVSEEFPRKSIFDPWKQKEVVTLKTEIAQLEGNINVLTKDKNELKRQYEQLKQKVGDDSTLLDNVSTLTKEINELKQKIENLRQGGGDVPIQQHIKIRDMLLSIAGSNIRKLLLCICGIVLFVIILCFIFSSGTQDTRTIPELESIENKIDKIWDSLKEQTPENDTISSTSKKAAQFPYDRVRINLSNKTILEKEKQNVLTIKDKNGNYTFDCSEYRIALKTDTNSASQGAYIIETDNSTRKNPQWYVKIPSTFSPKKVTIYCSVDDGEWVKLSGGERKIAE